MKKKYLLFGLLSTAILSIGAVVATNSKRDVLQMTFADTETYKLNTANWGEEIVTGEDSDAIVLTDKNSTRNHEGRGTVNSWINKSDSKKAHFEVTKATTEMWMLGMFIDTGIPMTAGKQYTVCFNAYRHEAREFEVILQNKQYDEKRYQTFYSPDGLNTAIIDVTEENAGTLWIYVQSGTQENEIEISRVCVQDNSIGNTLYSGYQYSGGNGYHFELLKSTGGLDSGKDWRIKMWYNDVAVTKDHNYRLHVDFDLKSKTNDLYFVSTISNTSAGNFKRQTFDTVADGLTFENDFTASTTDNSAVELHFGETVGAFHVVITKVVITDLSDDNKEVLSTFFEAPYDFAQRWNTANADAALCTANDADVKALLRLYADLVPWVRDDLADAEKHKANNVEAYPQFNDSSLASSVNYFAGKLNIIFA